MTLRIIVSKCFLLCAMALVRSSYAQSATKDDGAQVVRIDKSNQTANSATIPDSVDVIKWEGRSVSVVVREIEAATVAYVAFEGPYWGVGPVLTRVRLDMERADRSGLSFVRYGNDPRDPHPVGTPVKIGFFTEPGAPAVSGYVTEYWRVHSAAVATVLGPNSRITSLFPQIKQWAANRGFDAVGPIVEVYFPLPKSGRVEDQLTEIRMLVRVRREASSREASHSLPKDEAVDPTTVTETADRAGNSQSDQTPAVWVNELGEGQVGDTPADSIAAVADDYVTEPNPKRRRMESDALAASESADEAAIEDSFERRVLGGEYERALDEWIPATRRLGAEDVALLGAISDRVAAIADAVVMPEDVHTELNRLAAALKQTVERAARQSGLDPAAVAPYRPRTSGAHAGQLVRDLNRLMAQISLQSVDGAECIRELRRVVAAVGKVLGEPRPETK